jgi:hypothetical protein
MIETRSGHVSIDMERVNMGRYRRNRINERKLTNKLGVAYLHPGRKPPVSTGL